MVWVLYQHFFWPGIIHRKSKDETSTFTVLCFDKENGIQNQMTDVKASDLQCFETYFEKNARSALGDNFTNALIDAVAHWEQEEHLKERSNTDGWKPGYRQLLLPPNLDETHFFSHNSRWIGAACDMLNPRSNCRFVSYRWYEWKDKRVKLGDVIQYKCRAYGNKTYFLLVTSIQEDLARSTIGPLLIGMILVKRNKKYISDKLVPNDASCTDLVLLHNKHGWEEDVVFLESENRTQSFQGFISLQFSISGGKEIDPMFLEREGQREHASYCCRAIHREGSRGVEATDITRPDLEEMKVSVTRTGRWKYNATKDVERDIDEDDDVAEAQAEAENGGSRTLKASRAKLPWLKEQQAQGNIPGHLKLELFNEVDRHDCSLTQREDIKQLHFHDQKLPVCGEDFDVRATAQNKATIDETLEILKQRATIDQVLTRIQTDNPLRASNPMATHPFIPDREWLISSSLSSHQIQRLKASLEKIP